MDKVPHTLDNLLHCSIALPLLMFLMMSGKESQFGLTVTGTCSDSELYMAVSS